ncbi:hypothetical protein CRX67_05175 [Enterobacteriaceae bacterium A-F18]|nr:hypothetical protein CRX67_05175 [Enterobacteriaceae bacterium A-F18]
MTHPVMLAFADIHPNKPPGKLRFFKKKRDFLPARGCSVKENTHFFPWRNRGFNEYKRYLSALSFDQVTLLTRRYILMKNLIVERML